MTKYFVSDDEFLLISAAYKFKKLIQREGSISLAAAMSRCGVGLTHRQFLEIVQRAVNELWCFKKEGPHGGTKLIFNECFKDVRMPDGIERLEDV